MIFAILDRRKGSDIIDWMLRVGENSSRSPKHLLQLSRLAWRLSRRSFTSSFSLSYLPEVREKICHLSRRCKKITISAKALKSLFALCNERARRGKISLSIRLKNIAGIERDSPIRTCCCRKQGRDRGETGNGQPETRRG